MTKTRLAAGLAAIVALAAPAVANAAHSVYVDEVSSSAPGCEVRGLWLASTEIAEASLADGDYRYAVVALDAKGAPLGAACPAEPVAVDGAANAVALEWLPSPGAASYRIFRGPNTGPGSRAPGALSASGSSTAAALCPTSRCRFVDRGFAEGLQTPSFAAALTQAGLPADLRIVQRFDYGGEDSSSSSRNTSDDPFPAGLRTSVLRLPAGLLTNLAPTIAEGGAPALCPLYGEQSLLGDRLLTGTADADEGTCPRRTLVGEVRAIARVADPGGSDGATMPQFSVGEIYNGEPQAGEALRLFMVLRTQNGAAQTRYLTAAGDIGDRGAGAVSLDMRLEPAGGGELPDSWQLRELRQTLFGTADQGTASRSDDRPFMVLPTSCAAGAVRAETTTHAGPETAAGQRDFAATGCDGLTFAPTVEALLGGTGLNAPGALTSMTITLRQPAGQAAARVATLNLPPSLSTPAAGFGAACARPDFDALNCPAQTQKGDAIASSALLPFPLAGPIHLVDGAGGPAKLGIVLRGGALGPLRIVGDLVASPGGLTAGFAGLPTLPLDTLTLRLPSSGALLQNAGDLCAGAGAISAAMDAHSGASALPTAPVAVDQAGCPSVPPLPPAPIASGSLVRVGKGTPTLRLALRSAGSRRLRELTVTLPKGLTFAESRAAKGVRIRVGRKLLKAKPRFTKRTMKLRALKASRIEITVSRGALRVAKKVRKRSTRQRLFFGLAGKDTARVPYRVKLKIWPDS